MSQEQAERSCGIVRRYLTEAMFGGSERALHETVSDPELSERAWLFWAAFSARTIEKIDVLFANADGSQVACHLTVPAVQDCPREMSPVSGPGRPAPLGS